MTASSLTSLGTLSSLVVNGSQTWQIGGTKSADLTNNGAGGLLWAFYDLATGVVVSPSLQYAPNAFGQFMVIVSPRAFFGTIAFDRRPRYSRF